MPARAGLADLTEAACGEHVAKTHEAVARRGLVDGIGLDRLGSLREGMLYRRIEQRDGEAASTQRPRHIEADDRPGAGLGVVLLSRKFAIRLARRDRAPADRLVIRIGED